MHGKAKRGINCIRECKWDYIVVLKKTEEWVLLGLIEIKRNGFPLGRNEKQKKHESIETSGE